MSPSPAPSQLTIPQLTAALPPLPEIRDLADLLLSRGHSAAEVLDQLVAMLDELVPWDELVRGPAGKVLEASDGPLLRGIVRVIVAHVARRRSRPSA